MSVSLHLDLLTDEERLSSSPVRLRVMVPMLAALVVLCIVVWWVLFGFRLHAATLHKAAVEASIRELKTAHGEVLSLREQEKEYAASLKQLTYYRNARILFGATFALLAEQVPATVQLTELRVPPPPPPPPADPKRPLLGPTNVLEAVSLRLAGRAAGDHPGEGVDSLLQAIRKPIFTNLILHAEIPKGAFRQDTIKGNDRQNSLLFEITCDCVPRRFE